MSQDIPTNVLEEAEAFSYEILDFKILEKIATPESPFKFLFYVESATKGQYSGYLLRGIGYFRLKDAKNFQPEELEELSLSAGEKIRITFFTKTTLESQWENMFPPIEEGKESDWPIKIRGQWWQIEYAGRGKSDKGRDMHNLYARIVNMEASVPTEPHEE